MVDGPRFHLVRISDTILVFVFKGRVFAPMGGLATNRKRQDEFLSLHNSRDCCHFDNSQEFRNLKKRRLAFTIQPPKPQDKEVSLGSVALRVSRYPEIISGFRREVLGPVRTMKFGILLPLMRRESWDKAAGMGNFLAAQFNKAKESALGTIKFFGKEKGKQVIDLVEEDEDEGTRGEGSEHMPVMVDLIVEEIGGAEAVEETEERGRSAGSGSDYGMKKYKEMGVVVNVSQESVVSELTNWNATGLENAEKMLGSVSLSKDGVEVLSKSAYKKLLEEAQRRDAKLGFLDAQIRFNEEKWSSFQDLRPAKKPEKKVPDEPFIPLTKEEEAEVSSALYGNRYELTLNFMYYRVVDGFCSVGDFEGGLKVLNAMLIGKHYPRVETFRCLVTGLLSDGNLDGACFVIEEMEKRKIVTGDVWENVIGACQKDGHGHELLSKLVSAI